MNILPYVFAFRIFAFSFKNPSQYHPYHSLHHPLSFVLVERDVFADVCTVDNNDCAWPNKRDDALPSIVDK